MHHSGFFFDIMVKSMAQHLLSTGRIKMHRNERFSKDYHKKIENLLEVITPYLMNRYKEMPVETHELNKSLAHFLKVRFICLFIYYFRHRDELSISGYEKRHF